MLCLAIPVFSLSTHALTEQEKAKTKQIDIKMQEKQARIKKLTEQIYGANVQKVEIDKQLEKTKGKLKEAENNYLLIQKQVKNTSQNIEKAQEKYDTQLKYVKTRLRYMYKHKQSDYLNFLLDANDLNTFILRSNYFNYMAKKDTQILKDLQEKKEEMETLRRVYMQKREEISSVQKKYDDEKTSFQDNRDILEAYRQQMLKDKDTIKKELDALEMESMKIRGILTTQPVRARMGSGRIMWPVPSCTSESSPFGWRIHPVLGTSRFHAGIDIPAAYGSQVLATDNGVVISSGWQGGYGKAVIIDHGGGLASLYGHCSELYVRPGETVQRGQLVSLVGSTGMSTGPHLHFEVRQGGNPVAPDSLM